MVKFCVYGTGWHNAAKRYGSVPPFRTVGGTLRVRDKLTFLDELGPPFIPMQTIPSGILTFVNLRITETVGTGVRGALERRAKQESGVILDPLDGMFFLAFFPLVSSALTFARYAHEIFVRDEQAAEKGIRPALGIECGEVLQGATLKRLVSFQRSTELAELAYDGQNLIGPAAREVIRPSLAAGFGIIELGELRLGNSISAERVWQLAISGFPVDFPRIEALDDVDTNITEVPENFIGRDLEAAEIRRDLREGQLVTIVGPAGVGKSSLAYWLAFDLVEAYRDGAWKVDLAKIPRGGSVATAIAADLKLPSMPNHSNEERVRTMLSTMSGLVWLDNCEHVIEQARDVLPRILKFCPRVKFLVTSRTALGIEGKQTFDLHPFSVPTDLEDFADSEAFRLFLNRAKTADPEFDASPADLAVIAEICRRVDGLPLAIELAAAQVARYPLKTLLTRLSEAIKSASVHLSSRHKTLERALSWSYSLLDEKQQKFFRNLGVLAGPTRREIAVALGGNPRASEETSGANLDSLVSASLVQEIKLGAGRMYRLLEPMRQFALGQLDKHGEESAARTKLGKDYLDWFEKLEGQKMSEKRWVLQVSREMATLESTLNWLLKHAKGAKLALQLSVKLISYWFLEGHFDRAHELCALALERGKSVPGVDTGDIYCWIGTFAGYAGRYEDSKAALRKAIEFHAKSSNREREAVALTNLGLHLRNCGELEEAVKAQRRALELSEKGIPTSVIRMANLAMSLVWLGEIDEAKKYQCMAAELNKVVGDAWARAVLEAQATTLNLLENNTASAEINASKCLESYREVGSIQGLLWAIELVGFLALRLGNVERAAKLIAGAAKHFFTRGVGRPPIDEQKKNEALHETETALGGELAEALYAEGAQMSLDELYDLARSGVGS